MTRVASRRESNLPVVRIRRAVVIRHVARRACRASQVVIAVHMALNARRCRVHPGQREACC